MPLINLLRSASLFTPPQGFRISRLPELPPRRFQLPIESCRHKAGFLLRSTINHHPGAPFWIGIPRIDCIR